MPVGTNAIFGYGAEGTPGTAVAPTGWIPMKDAEGDLDPGIIFPELMGFGRQVTRYALRGEQKVRGKIITNLFQDMGIEFLSGAIGLVGATVPDRYLLQTFTLQLQKGSAATFDMPGCMIDKQTVKVAGGKEVTVETEFYGLDQIVGSPGTEVYSDTQPYSFSDGEITFGGVVDPDITEVEWKIDNNLVEQWTVRRNNAARRTESGKMIVTGKLHKYFANEALWLAFKAMTSQSLTVNFTLGAGSVTYTFPKIIMKMNKIPVKLGQFIMQEVEWHAAVDAATGAELQLAIG